MLNAYDLVLKRLKPMLSPELLNQSTEVACGKQCDYCLNPIKGEAKSHIDSYKFNNIICETCNLFTEQLPTILGLERGNIGYKLSSFKSGIIAIPKDERLPVELWVGGKYPGRLKKDTPFKVVDCAGNQAKFELCESIGKYALITEISLRREMFLRYLSLSTDNNIAIGSDLGVCNINKKQYQQLKKALLAENLNPKVFNELVTTINGIKTDRVDILSDRAQSALTSLSNDTRKAISEVADPTSLLFMLSALRAGIYQ